MKKFARAFSFTLLILCSSSHAENTKNITISAQDNILTFLNKQNNQQVTLMLKSGEEVTGTLKKVGQQLIHIHQLKGREYFDAVVLSNEIEGITFRNR